MNRKIGLVALLVGCLLILCGCGCAHEWREASCEVAKTCTLCGKTEGEPLMHSWTPANCDTAETCTSCGKTQGNPVGHDWQAATCTEDETCLVCGQTNTEALGHTWADATCVSLMTCEVCGETQGDFADHTWQEANCLSPQTCSICEETTGEIGDHIWAEATCILPATCQICQETKGRELGHKLEKATCILPKTCGVCGETEGEPLGHTAGDWSVTVPATKDTAGTRVKLCKVCGEELEKEEYTMTEEEIAAQYKKECVSIAYNDLQRNPGENKGKKIKFTGTVFQIVSEAESALYYSVYFIRANGNLYCVMLDNYGTGTRILEDDRITIYGEFTELYTYETVRGNSNTIPKVFAEYYE